MTSLRSSLLCLLAVSTMAGSRVAVGARPKISITKLTVDQAEAARGESFTLRAAAVGKGVDVRSYRVRTPYKLAREHVPPGFYLEHGLAVYRADKGAILDNGKFDLDPSKGSVAVEISTKNLSDGVHYLVVFAHNRPGPGRHVMDFRNLRLDVGRDKVGIQVVGKEYAPLGKGIEFLVPSGALKPGELMVCGAKLADEQGGLTLRLRPPYTWDKTEVLDGFRYYPKEKVGYVEDGPDHMIVDNGKFDKDPSRGSIRVEVPTDRWPPGAHFLTLEAPSLHTVRAPYRGTGKTYRDFAVRVADSRDQFQVEVSPSVRLASGTHFSAMVSLGNGKILAHGHFSDDGGHTWTKLPKVIPNPNLLSDGTLIGMAYRAYPVEGQKGVYTGQLYLSKDGGRTVEGPIPSKVLVPKARAALGHGPHVGPLFGRSIVELDNGDLIAGMYGWFDGDTEPDRYRKGGTMRRSYVGISSDRGRTWQYLSTVAYRPFLGNEGYSELVIRKLPNDEILALVRTGGNSNPGWQDNPLMMSRSSDGGKTWAPVRRTGVEGCWPDLCVLSDGALVCTTGRPGAFIMFSTDNGHTWTDITPIGPERYSGYTAICELAPGELLMGYGARHWLDPQTGQRTDQLRLVRIKVRRR